VEGAVLGGSGLVWGGVGSGGGRAGDEGLAVMGFQDYPACGQALLPSRLLPFPLTAAAAAAVQSTAVAGQMILALV